MRPPACFGTPENQLVTTGSVLGFGMEFYEKRAANGPTRPSSHQRDRIVVTRVMRWILCLAVLSLDTSASAGDDEISLFNSNGKARAYIAIGEEMTIYMWNGKPAAYLESDRGVKGFRICGFNGKHLGWFVDGVVRDHQGDAACAVKERMESTESQPTSLIRNTSHIKITKNTLLTDQRSQKTLARLHVPPS